MPEGLVNSGDFSAGNPVPATDPSFNTNPVPQTNSDWAENDVPIDDPTFNSNPVTWVPSPDYFGNQVGPVLPPAPTFSPAAGPYIGTQTVYILAPAPPPNAPL